MRIPATTCYCCSSTASEFVYRAASIPVSSVVLISDEERARHYPVGDLELLACRECGFVWNHLFDPRLVQYGEDYEGTQAYSETFNRFHRDLAERMIGRYGLRGKHIVEVGCGQGVFLELLCELGDNTGVGFDPSWRPSGRRSVRSDGAKFISDYFSPTCLERSPDFVCCKMTLEHIWQPAELLQSIKAGFDPEREVLLFLMVPNAERIFREGAFWDVYYEHCCYFGPASLRRLVESCGLEVLRVADEYDGQYLTVEARSSRRRKESRTQLDARLTEIRSFETMSAALIESWRRSFGLWQSQGRRIVLWGGGSKAVSFLTSVGSACGVEFVVDINPLKHDHFLPKTGQRVVGADFLVTYRPDVVVLMNPIYENEVSDCLRQLGISASLICVNDPPHGPESDRREIPPPRQGIVVGAQGA